MTDIIIKKKNEVYVTVKAEPAICQELSDLFTFDVPGAKFMPQYRNKYWDGKIRLFNLQKNQIYVGLLDKIVQFVADTITITNLRTPSSMASRTKRRNLSLMRE